MPYKPGQSGNPKGRPKGTTSKVIDPATGETVDLRAEARKFTMEALDILRRIASDETADLRARVQACNAILDRGHGKPGQDLTVKAMMQTAGQVAIVPNVTLRGV